jgi:hypothetical protein
LFEFLPGHDGLAFRKKKGCAGARAEDENNKGSVTEPLWQSVCATARNSWSLVFSGLRLNGLMMVEGNLGRAKKGGNKNDFFPTSL